MSQGLKLKVVGMNMLNEVPEVAQVMSFLSSITVPQTPRNSYHSRLVNTQPIRSQERIIVSPGRSHLEN